MTWSPTARLKSYSKELIKQYVAYDVYSRPEYIYEARADASDEDPCICTQYVYDGLTSNIVKMKETNSSWDSDWDI